MIQKLEQNFAEEQVNACALRLIFSHVQKHISSDLRIIY